jgi:peptidyl-prolyl cis-trans isomerase D
MLNLLRNRGLGSFVVGAMVIATAVVFVWQWNPSTGQKTRASLSRTCAVVVKGHCVDPKDHRAAFLMLVPRDRSGARLMKRAMSMGLPRIALDGLIERELLVSEAERIGLTATEDETADNIFNGIVHVSLPSDRPELGFSLGVQDGKIRVNFRDSKTNTFDEKSYKRMLKYLADRSPVEFREEQERELLAAKMRDLVRAPVRVSDQEAFESYVAEKSQATLSYVEVKQKYVARWMLSAQQAEIDGWAKLPENAKAIDAELDKRKESHLPKAGHVRHILIKVAPSANAKEKQEALAKLSEAYGRIKAGEAFADIAREYGQDGTAPNGGDLGDKTEGFVEAFRKAADALTPGEMTEKAIETQFGYHLIAKDDPARAAEIAKQLQRDAARELYLKAKGQELAHELATKIAKAMKAGASGDEAVKAVLSEIKAVAKPQALLEIVPDPSLKHDAPDAGAAAAGDAGAAPTPAPEPMTPLTDPDRPQLQSSPAFNRGGDPLPMLAGQELQKTMEFAFGAKDGEVMPEPRKAEGGWVVVALKEHKNATREDYEKERDVYVQTLLAAKQAEALATYVRRLKEASKADVKVDEKYMIDTWSQKDGGAAGGDDDEGY